MIDLRDLPMPADAPEEGACLQVLHPEPGLVEIVLDPPHRKLAVLDLPLMRDLDRALALIEDQRDVRGLILRGRTPLEFAAGADIDAIEAIEDPALVEKFIRFGQSIFQRIADMGERRVRPVRTVAAVGGAVPGGAFELSLACSRILLAKDPKSRIGLPETQLGILPAWGGCNRLPRRVGVPTALDAILKGRLLTAKAAWKKGFVDRLTPSEYLFDVARDVALGRKPCKRRGGGARSWLVDRNPLVLWLVSRKVQAQLAKQTRGRYPAPVEAARIATWAAIRPIAKGLDEEARAASLLAVGPVCKHLIGIFKRMEDAKKLGKSADGSAPPRLTRGAVLGAGVMGGGIASVMAEKGVATRLFDISPEGLDAALVSHRREMDKKRRRRRLEKHEHAAAIDHLDATPELIGFGGAEVVVEAVAERLDVKRDLFGQLEDLVPTDCLLLTNTSSLSVDAIAEGLRHPERFAGMHFFNPVRRMPLVEVIRGKHTSEDVLTRVSALALRMGKTPVVVRDVAGFLVNRLLGPYLDEALRLYAGGADPERVDAAALDFGMPMGPFTLLDEVGLDIATHAAGSLHAAYGDRMEPSRVIEGLVAEGRLGKKTGAGFYVHDKANKKGRPVLSEDLARIAAPTSDRYASADGREIMDHLLLAMLNEAARCLEEGVVESADALDLATVFGMGFPPFRGGLLRWADSLGATEVVQRMEALAEQEEVRARGAGAERFVPVELLRSKAGSGVRLAG